jgi:hypothetical protein
MTNNNKRRNSNNKNGKGSSPRHGAKAKQTKVTPAKETDSKAVRQTTLTFAPTGTQTPGNRPTPPNDDPIISTAAITPEGPRTRLAHPSPCTTPERPTKTPPSTKAPLNQKNNTKTQKNSVPNDDSSNNDTAPATNQSPSLTKSNPPSPTNITTTPKKAQFQATVDNEITGIDTSAKPSSKHVQITTTTTEETDSIPKDLSTKKKVPLNLQSPAKTYESIRYNGQIVTPPSEQPYPDFLKILTDFFSIVQDVLGKDVYIAAWDSEQERTFPPIKRPSKLPSSRESLGIYLGTYVNPKKDGSRIYLNLRLITFKQNPVPLARFGIELSDHFSNSKHDMFMQRQPRPCQAAKTECIGWLMYSAKSMNSSTFVPALKRTLKIPDTVAVGIQYRTAHLYIRTCYSVKIVRPNLYKKTAYSKFFMFL